jgi:hypothetical protein
MITKGKPTARSRLYKANFQIQDKITSTPTTVTLGIDVISSLIFSPVTFDEGGQRSIDTVKKPNQTLHKCDNNGINIWICMI